jgi:N-acetylneuraminic acid mutarotase
MIIWGGIDASQVKLHTGARYDPTTDTWTPTSIGTNVPDSRMNHTAVWTGSEMIVWGGEEEFGNVLNTGGQYNPFTDSWQPTSTGTDAPWSRTHHTAVWTGTEMIIWGGVQDEWGLNSGGRYNPVSDTWLIISDNNAPGLRLDHTAVWTGNEMIIWGGIQNIDYDYPIKSGGRYDPLTDTWKPTPTAGTPLQRGEHTAVWTGNEMIIWSGNWSTWYMKHGGRYSLAGNDWTGMAIGTNAPSGRSEATAIWTGSKMIVFGGYDEGIGSGYWRD